MDNGDAWQHHDTFLIGSLCLKKSSDIYNSEYYLKFVKYMVILLESKKVSYQIYLFGSIVMYIWNQSKHWRISFVNSAALLKTGCSDTELINDEVE